MDFMTSNTYDTDWARRSAWEDGLDVIDSLMKPGSPTYNAMTEDQRIGLKSLKMMLLLSGGSDSNMDCHIPKALLVEETQSNDVLLSVFAGYTRRIDASRSFKQIISAHKIAKKLRVKAHSKRLSLVATSNGTYLPKQWLQLDPSAQLKLRDMLSWEKLSKWDFDIFEVDKVCRSKHTLVLVAWAIIGSPNSQYAMDLACQEINKRNGVEEESVVQPLTGRNGYGFIEQFDMKDETLIQFLQAIEDRYLTTPCYHNKVHAADVLQSLHAILEMGGKEFIPNLPIELFAILIAAVVHDVGHPGMNNLYQINSRSDVAIRYNDISVLENMHLATTFEIIMGKNRDENANILDTFTDEQVTVIRDLIIKSVLNTDMTKHFAKKNLVKGLLLSEVAQKDPTVLAKDSSARHEILGFMLHLADISNPAKIIETGSTWTDRVLDEFFLQGDKEAELSLPVSPMCDRHSTSRPQSQIGFISFIVLPAYELLGQLIPRITSEILPILKSNQKYWQEKKHLEVEKEDEESDDD